MKGCFIKTDKPMWNTSFRSIIYRVTIIVCCVSSLGYGATDAFAYCETQAGTAELQVEKPLVVLTATSHAELSISKMLPMEFRNKYSQNDINAYIELAGKAYSLKNAKGKEAWVYTSNAGFDSVGWADIVLSDAQGEVLRLGNALRLIDKFRITLTFDDGPGIDKKSAGSELSTSPTIITLDGLDRFVHGENGAKKGVKAAFFVLTTQDEFFKIKYGKAETVQGKAILREVVNRGHVVGVHAGGEYKSQKNGHDKRALLPAYDVLDRSASSFCNALEADLYECVTTIERVTGQRPEFVRPPLWKYSNKRNPEVRRLVLGAYRKFGLKMILSDAKFPDGGYYLISIVAIQKYWAYRKKLKRAFLSGEDNIVISMHDSNAYTANIIDSILAMIVTEFDKIEFAGTCASAEYRLDFADTAEEVKRNLEHKKEYVMFPSYREYN